MGGMVALGALEGHGRRYEGIPSLYDYELMRKIITMALE
jgi:hypothetical protein